MGLLPRDFKSPIALETKDTKEHHGASGKELARCAVLVDTRFCSVVRGTVGAQSLQQPSPWLLLCVGVELEQRIRRELLRAGRRGSRRQPDGHGICGGEQVT